MRHLRGAAAAVVVLGLGCGGAQETPRIADTGASVRRLSVSVSGPGSVRSAPPGIACDEAGSQKEGAVCSLAVPEGSALLLTAAPAPDAVFSGWTGACSGTAGCTVAAGATVGAVFAQAAAPDDCAGLLPASLPPPATVAQPQGFTANCTGGTSDDGAGNFVLGFTAGGVTTYPAFAFFTVQGAQAVEIGQRNFGSDQGTVRFFSQPSGFTKLSTNETAGARELSSWSHEGAMTSSALLTSSADPRPSYAAASADPSGGTVAAISRKAAVPGWVNVINRYDKAGNLESSAGIDGAGMMTATAVGVDLSGNALVFAQDTAAQASVARWFDRSGAPLTPWFPAPSATEAGFLADGSVVARAGRPSEAVGRYQAGQAGPSPLPQWLQERAQDRLFVVRGGLGYASWGSGGMCGGGLEVLSASGRSCGCLAVPNLGTFSSVGRDGSLIVPAQDGATCHYDLYPQVLK